MDLASLRSRVDSANWQEQKVPSAMNMQTQVNGAPCLGAALPSAKTFACLVWKSVTSDSALQTWLLP